VPPRKQPVVNPIIILVVCVCVVAMMFVGSILIGTLVVQSERQQPAAEQSGEP
jgi:hypothetical protein